MEAERWKKIDDIFQAALDQEPDRRAAFLDQACAGDADLRGEVESLIESYERATGFIESPVHEAATELIIDTATGSLSGKTIGPYSIIASIGEGGMGEVYLAQDTRLARKVALKMLPAYFTQDEQRLRRFKQEARATSALNHPNIITIFEVGQDGPLHFIATEYIDGETLRRRISRAKIGPIEAIDIAVQAAGALQAAHEAGVVHRDIKPENIMLRRDGYVKVLDFGLAKLTDRHESRSKTDANTSTMLSTDPGVVMGTINYMSPEQARGLRVDARTDLFSLGVVLYEMLTRRAPFEGATTSDVIVSILTTEPPPLSVRLKTVPAELDRIVAKSLAKDADERYRTAKELLTDLKNLKQELEFETKLLSKDLRTISDQDPDRGVESGIYRDALSTVEIKNTLPASPGSFEAGDTADNLAGARKTSPDGAANALALWWKTRRKAAVFVAAVLILAASAYGIWRSANLRWAREQIPLIEELSESQSFFEAYDLAMRVREHMPDDPTLLRLMPRISDTLSVTTEPEGAQVYLKRFLPDEAGRFPERQFAGVTPLLNHQIARGDYVLYIEKDGYAGTERVISGALLSLLAEARIPPPIRVEQKLVEAHRVPDRMAFVPGGDYRMVAHRRPTDARVRLDDYLIDKYEVTNQEYKQFITSGGYLKKQYWKHPFIKDGRALSWEEAIGELTDRTGLPGPRSWSNQNYPEAKAEHPVTDITWHEAAAYAEFRGKQLPTIFQWEKAARSGLFSFAGLIMPWGLLQETTEHRANFKSNDTMPADSNEFGLSPFGCYNMAGNVAEWCLNEASASFFTGGGSWDDPSYLFGFYGVYPGFYSSSKLGFRCVLNPADAKSDQGAMRIDLGKEIPEFTPASDASFKDLIEQYSYEKTPLDAEIVEAKDTDEWRREKITYNGANGKRAIAYLYLPKNYQRPLQVITFLPGDDVANRIRSLPDAIETNFAALIKAGRAVFGVVLEGYIEREPPADYRPLSPETVEFVERTVARATDVRRGLDYLETRDDIDKDRMAYLAASVRGFKVIISAVEPRFRAVILTGTGARKDEARWAAAASAINFAPQIRAPKLLVHGRYDEAAPLKYEGEPLYKLMREPKRIFLYDGGHIPDQRTFFPAVNGWLDETLGPVRRD